MRRLIAALAERPDRPRLHRRRADRHAAGGRAQGQAQLALPRARLRGPFVAGARTASTRSRSRPRSSPSSRAWRARARDQRPVRSAYDVALHDGPHRRDPRRHRAQHRAARLQLRFRDPASAVRRSRCLPSPRCSAFAAALLPAMRAVRPEDGHRVRGAAAHPRLRHRRRRAEISRLVAALTGANGTGKVSFGTEGGLFQQAGIPTVDLRPGLDRAGAQARRMGRARADRPLRGVHAAALSTASPR